MSKKKNTFEDICIELTYEIGEIGTKRDNVEIQYVVLDTAQMKFIGDKFLHGFCTSEADIEEKVRFVICVSNYLHFSMNVAMLRLDMNEHVFIEKSCCSTGQTATDLITKVEFEQFLAITRHAGLFNLSVLSEFHFILSDLVLKNKRFVGSSMMSHQNQMCLLQQYRKMKQF